MTAPGQLSLLDTPAQSPPVRRYRRSDPETSREAAEANHGLIEGQGALVLDAVKRFPGKVGTELGDILHKERGGDKTKWRYAVSRRTSELAEKYLIHRGDSRKRKGGKTKETTWWPAVPERG